MDSVIEFIKNNTLLVKGVIILVGYIVTFFLTTFLVKKIVLKGKKSTDVNQDGVANEKDKSIIRDGLIIGKCENIIILSFVIASEVTGLALIFAAKSIARQKDFKDNAGYYLAGTMVNFTATLVLAFVLKFILEALPQ